MFGKNIVILHQPQRRCTTTLKAGARLKGIGRERDKLNKTANRKAKAISQSEREH